MLINLWEAYVRAFGYTPKFNESNIPGEYGSKQILFDKKELGQTEKSIYLNFGEINTNQESRSILFSQIPQGQNAEIVDRIHFPSGSYSFGGKEIQYEAFTIPEISTVEYSRTKKIVETAVMGRSGSVKELVTIEDWSVSIKGILTDGCFEGRMGNAFPEKELFAMNRFFKANATLPVEGRIINGLEIYNLIVKSFKFSRMDEFPNCVAFALDFISDDATEIGIKKDKTLSNDFLRNG